MNMETKLSLITYLWKNAFPALNNWHKYKLWEIYFLVNQELLASNTVKMVRSECTSLFHYFCALKSPSTISQLCCSEAASALGSQPGWAPGGPADTHRLCTQMYKRLLLTHSWAGRVERLMGKETVSLHFLSTPAAQSYTWGAFTVIHPRGPTPQILQFTLSRSGHRCSFKSSLGHLNCIHWKLFVEVMVL